MTWAQRIARAIKVGHFMGAEKALARRWKTCAIGEAHKAHPKIVLIRMGDDDDPSNLSPIDPVLGNFGTKFCDAVMNGDTTMAGHLHARIEDRVRELKARST